MNSETDVAGARTTPADRGGAPPAGPANSTFSAGESIWIIDQWRDVLFFVATPLLLIPLFLLSQGRLATTSLYLVVLTFGAVGHQLPCFLRAYGDRDLFARYRTRLYIAPAITLAIGFGFAFAGLSGLSVILLFWGFWHVLTQQYGFLRIYDAKVGSFEPTTIRLDFLICFFWFGAGVVYSPQRMYQLLDRFYAAGGPLLNPTWVSASQLLWGFLTVVVTAAFVMNYVYQRRQGQAASLVKLLTLAAGIGIWWFAMVNVRDLLAGILLFELFHDIQYLALTRHYGCRRMERGGDMGPIATQLFRRGMSSLVLYLAVVLLYGLPAFLTGISPAWLEYSAAQSVWFKTVYALVAASTLLHFYCDSFIWLIRDKEVRNTLELPAAPAPAGLAWPLAGRVPHLLIGALMIVPVVWIGYTEWHSEGPAEGVNASLAEAVPTSWQARARLGAELLEQGRVEEAVEQLREATELGPEAVAPLCDLGRAMRQLGRFPDALEYFEKAVEIAPLSVLAQSELGKTLFGLGEMKEGREHLLLAVNLAPHDAALRYDVALAEARTQNFEEALKAIDYSIELDGSNAAAFNARGNIYWNIKDLQQAATDFDKALELDPKLIKAYRNRAQVRMASGDVQNAIADLSEAIKLDGTLSRDFVIRGDIFYSLNQFDKARADYAEAILREKTHVDPMERMITLLTTCPDESYRNMETAISLAQTMCKQSNFSEPRSLQLLAATYALAGQYDQAIRWQEQAITLAPPEIQEEMRKRSEQFKQAQVNQPKEVEQSGGESGDPGDASATADPAPAGQPPRQ